MLLFSGKLQKKPFFNSRRTMPGNFFVNPKNIFWLPLLILSKNDTIFSCDCSL